jgi:hypothetical protein
VIIIGTKTITMIKPITTASHHDRMMVMIATGKPESASAEGGNISPAHPLWRAIRGRCGLIRAGERGWPREAR